MANSSEPMSYTNALNVLADAGVLKASGSFRDAHTEVTFAEAAIDATGSHLTKRPVSEQDWMRLLGHLMAAAAERGLQPAELLAIGMATALQKAAKPG